MDSFWSPQVNTLQSHRGQESEAEARGGDWAVTQGRAAQTREGWTRGDWQSPLGKAIGNSNLGFQFEGGERPGAWGLGVGAVKEGEMERGLRDREGRTEAQTQGQEPETRTRRQRYTETEERWREAKAKHRMPGAPPPSTHAHTCTHTRTHTHTTSYVLTHSCSGLRDPGSSPASALEILCDFRTPRLPLSLWSL